VRYLNTAQHKHRINTSGYSCLRWDSNPRLQCLGDDTSCLTSSGHCERHCPISGRVEVSTAVTIKNVLLNLLVNVNVVPSSPILFTLMIEAIRSSKTSVLRRATRRHIPEDGILHSHCPIAVYCCLCANRMTQMERLTAANRRNSADPRPKSVSTSAVCSTVASCS
jgi:hypothetical protein